ncbi:MAG TPA: zinc-dependent peptidase [Saprospiraceae bacterium]|nr:zinc-dependent peptidase [Saprospiraceae bacterium]
MNARRIMVLAAAAVVGFGYFIFFKDRDDLIIYLAISLIIMVVAYVFQYQLDQIMTRGTPLKLDAAMRNMLLSTAPHFKAMSPMQQLLVEDRMMRWVMKKDFINQNDQDAPEDVKFILAYYAILLTIHQEAYNYDGLDRIIFYHHPFLSPHFSEEVHLIEIEKEDGSLIISVPHLLKGHLEQGYYNIGIHLMAEAYQHLYMKHPIHWNDDIWNTLEDMSTISKQAIDLYLGIPVEDPWPVALHHQVIYKDAQISEVLHELPQLAREPIMLK